ncbi:uncharacterized protein YhaN [Natranaerovirga hydrolytica]|uniref:Uncharacterized protein YhaN n=1 Tax=Natranaerovirga hydrolytica TaxID=680378 RepID=A0A4R1MAB0_9FIRM|nr:AAA family ATPase [Natranaerovirga hydrolytica]TCK87884.1 uncharacterized protein YhaN [Natranaerovirga hydrolytica]
MIIHKLYIKGFGKISNKEIILKNGINIIYGENEAGKTTIHQFIEGMLFGFFKPFAKKKIYTQAYDQYMPWDIHKGYEGHIQLEIDETIYRIEREFLKGHDKVKVYLETTGEDITDTIGYHSVTKLTDLSHLLGISETTFKNTVSVKQLGAKTESELASELKDYVTNLASAKDQDISVENVLKKLEQKSDAIGTYKRSSSPLGKVTTKVEALEDELKNTKNVYEDLLNKKDTLNHIEEKIEGLTEEKITLEKYKEQLRQKELKNKYTKAIKLQEELQSIDRELFDLNPYESIDINLLNESMETVERIKHLEHQIETLKKEKIENLSKIQRLEEAINQLELENLTKQRLSEIDSLPYTYNTYVDYEYRENHLKNKMKTILQKIKDNKESTTDDLIEQCYYYDSLEDENMSLISELNNYEAQYNATVNKESNHKKRQYIFSSLTGLGLLANIPVFIMSLGGIWINIVLAILAVSFFYLVKQESSSEQLEQANQKNIKNTIEQLQEKLNSNASKQREILHHYEVNDNIELQVLKETSQRTKNNIEDLKKDLEEQEIELERLQNQKHKNYNQMINLMKAIGWKKMEINEEIIDKIIFAGKKSKEKINEIDFINQSISNNESKQEALEKNVEVLKKKTNSILEKYSFDSIEDIKDGIEKKKKRNALQSKKESKDEILKEVLQEHTLETLKKEISITEAFDDIQMDIETLESRMKEIQKVLEITSKEYAAIDAEINERKKNLRSIGAIKTELDNELNKKNQLENELKAIALAKKTLTTISKEIQNDFAPILNEQANYFIRSITNNKYEKVKITDKMEIFVEDKNIRKMIAIHQLSNGTIDQMYLALRLGVLSLLNKAVHYPILLDDAFIQYDDKRINSVLKWIDNEKKQVILFTCQKREKEILEKNNIDTHYIHLDR